MDNIGHASTGPKSLTKTQQVFVDCLELSIKMREFARRGESEMIVDEVVAHFKKAKKYLFNKLAGEFATFLQRHYFLINEDGRLGAKYSNLALHYNELGYFEQVVKIKFSRITFLFNRTKNPDSTLVKKLEAVCEELKPYLKYESAAICNNVYSLLNLLAHYRGEVFTIVEQCETAIKFMEDRGIERTLSLYKDLTTAYIQLGEYDKAVVAIEKAMANIRKSNSAWSVLVYYRLIIELHRKNYQEAYEIYKEVEGKRYIKKNLNKVIYETWYFVKGYIKFLIQVGEIKAESHQFKIGHFLNSIIVFNKDKSGHKINTLILKIILRLDSEKGRDTIIVEREAIKKYSEENFEKDSRARILFRKLLHIVPGDFSKSKVKQRVEKNVNPMPNQAGYDPDLEILPYEAVWELLQGLLKR